jgi:hypothetical protein
MPFMLAAQLLTGRAIAYVAKLFQLDRTGVVSVEAQPLPPQPSFVKIDPLAEMRTGFIRLLQLVKRYGNRQRILGSTTLALLYELAHQGLASARFNRLSKTLKSSLWERLVKFWRSLTEPQKSYAVPRAGFVPYIDASLAGSAPKPYRLYARLTAETAQPVSPYAAPQPAPAPEQLYFRGALAEGLVAANPTNRSLVSGRRGLRLQTAMITPEPASNLVAPVRTRRAKMLEWWINANLPTPHPA